MVAARQSIRILGLISTFVMARILFPEDFGLVAQAMMVLAFMELLSSFGFELSLIQDQSAGRREYDTAWTLNILKACFSASMLVIVAAPMAGFFEDARLEEIIYALAAINFISGFINIGIINFRKQMWFGPDFALMVTPKFVGMVTNIAFALYLKSYWALVIGTAAQVTCRLTLSYVASRYRPRFSLAAWRDMFGFSKWILLNDYMRFLLQQTPVFAIGKFVGTAPVGLYRMAAEIGDVVSYEVYLPVVRTLYPAYANDKAGAGGLYLKAVGACFMALAPACVGLALVAEPAVQLILGDRWLPIVPLVEVLAISRLLFAVWMNPGMVAMADGRSRDNAVLTLIMGLVTIPALLILTPLYGLDGAIWAIFIGSSLYYFACLIYVTRVLRLSFVEIVRIKWRTLVSTGAMAGVLLWMPDTLWQIAAGAAVYVACQFVLWIASGRPEGPEHFVFTRLGISA